MPTQPMLRNTEKQDSDFVMPTMICPKCGIETIDWDGFGVLFCVSCGYCAHAAQSGNPMICDFCGKEMEI